MTFPERHNLISDLDGPKADPPEPDLDSHADIDHDEGHAKPTLRQLFEGIGEALTKGPMPHRPKL